MIDLSTLNEEQREAVMDEENNLLILACAGSGKTRTITTKIAYAIEKGTVQPWQVCAVTFTNRAAKEMRDRVASLLPDVDTTQIVLRTFHSLGATLLRRFGSNVELNSDFTIYDDDDSLQLLASAVGNDINSGSDSRQKKAFLREIQKSISKAKDLGMGPEDSDLDSINKEPKFKLYFQLYQQALERTGNVDFADLIMKSTELLKFNEEVRDYCHRRFKMVLVDEYQDSNKEQFNFLRLFVGDNTQLIVVGDDDQSIYSFRGAEIENILTFSSQFNNVREIKLEKNYRSTDEILAPAAALIKNNKSRHPKDIVSADGKKGQKPMVMCSSSGLIEAQRVMRIISSDRNYNNTAILYRTNAQSLLFETEAAKNHIPYKVIGALKFYDREEIKDSLAFLRLLINHRDEISFRRIINKPPRGIGDKKIEEIVSSSTDLMEALESFAQSTSGKAKDGAESFLYIWKKAEKELEENENLGIITENAIRDIGLVSYYESEKDDAVKKSRFENLSQLVSTLSEEDDEEELFENEEENRVISSKNKLRSFLENITLDTTVLGSDDPRDKEGVTLITMHNTKGLEYDRVFCVGLEQSLIPGERNSFEIENKEEERRIMYVAMTRARKSLYLSYATQRMVWGRTQYQSPSCFLKEIPENLLSGDTDKLFKTGYSSSFFSSSFSGYNSSYTSTFRKKESSVSNTPSWAKDILSESKTEAKEVQESTKIQRETGFKVGDRVKSEGRGEGSIIEIEVRDQGKRIISALFDDGRKMKFVEGHANVEKL